MAYRNRQDYRARREECAFCGDPLGGEQSLFCSQNCRVKFRYHENKAKRVHLCEVCKEPLRGLDFRKKRCTLGTGPEADAGPGDPCWDLQNAEIAANQEAENTRDFPTCLHCGEESEYLGGGDRGGRHRKYCSDSCRVAAYRARKRKGIRRNP